MFLIIVISNLLCPCVRVRSKQEKASANINYPKFFFILNLKSSSVLHLHTPASSSLSICTGISCIDQHRKFRGLLYIKISIVETMVVASDHADITKICGHRKEALRAVKELLPETAEGDLASVCSWPDEIKYMYKWRCTSELHYVDTPDFRCNYDYGKLTSLLQF
ncbi:hypothetical protein L1987_20334 [Smallanthus sonchifolius]|uniref:Uncharacterized protein n=1 Tax=Smallanthus sonchifolius TaxID=185202 RepID=A0ACB9IRJ0_9ASTR|nr:hypothetical protein L1987_20334 [Smallanthus sonchifolius]